jgi:hypothetical protein
MLRKVAPFSPISPLRFRARMMEEKTSYSCRGSASRAWQTSECRRSLLISGADPSSAARCLTWRAASPPPSLTRRPLGHQATTDSAAFTEGLSYASSRNDDTRFPFRWLLRYFSYWLSRTLSWAGGPHTKGEGAVPFVSLTAAGSLIGDVEVPGRLRLHSSRWC